MIIRSSEVLGLGLALAIAQVVHAEPPTIVQQEINHLIRDIGDSGCEFERNGSWNDSKVAQAHVRGKYDLLVKLDLIDTTEDFINKAATESILSGRPYAIRCGNHLLMPSSLWLNSELKRYRASKQ